jgi:hypothetical protein
MRSTLIWRPKGRRLDGLYESGKAAGEPGILGLPADPGGRVADPCCTAGGVLNLRVPTKPFPPAAKSA